MLNDIAELRTFVHIATAGSRTVGRPAESALLWVDTVRDVPETYVRHVSGENIKPGDDVSWAIEALAGDLWHMMVKAQK